MHTNTFTGGNQLPDEIEAGSLWNIQVCMGITTIGDGDIYTHYDWNNIFQVKEMITTTLQIIACHCVQRFENNEQNKTRHQRR